MSKGKQHTLPSGLPPALDLRVPPVNPWRAQNFIELADHLVALGEEIDRGPVAPARLRAWERMVTPLLHESEVGALMAPPSDFEFSAPAALAESRFRNLRSILLIRKGIDVR